MICYAIETIFDRKICVVSDLATGVGISLCVNGDLPNDVKHLDTFDDANECMIKFMQKYPDQFCRIIKIDNIIWKLSYIACGKERERTWETFDGVNEFVKQQINGISKVKIEQIEDRWRKIT